MIVVNTKKQVEKRLAELRLAEALRPTLSCERRLKISHLESALQNWIESKSEYTFILV